VDGDLVHTGTTAGVVSWDFSDRDHPVRLASVVLQDAAQSVTALPEPSTLLAVATGPSGLALVDTKSVKDEEIETVNEHPWSADRRNGCHTAWRFVAADAQSGFLACGSAGVSRVDLQEPKKPDLGEPVSVGGYVRDVAVLDESSGVPGPAASNKKVAVAAGMRGLAVADFGGLAPRQIAEVGLGGEARGLALHDGHAYVAAGAAGLVVVDLRKPAQPLVVGRLLPETTDMARGIAMSGDRALLCLGDSGLVIVDVDDPSKPRELGRFDPDRALNRVAVRGAEVFVANDDGGVAVLDVTDPRKPSQVYPPEAAGEAGEAN